jgi:hypothetical protein
MDQHTWRSNRLPKLEVADIEGGDVALCGSLPSGAPLLAELDRSRIAFATPLGSRADLEWLLRGLLLHPSIRHLVVCGDDPRASAEALLALWKEGLDEEARIAGSRGLLSQELDAAAIDALRTDVQLVDLRDAPLAEVAGEIRQLPALAAQREPREVSSVPIPGRKVFLSRKTSYPIFSSDVADSWLQLLNLALRIGIDKPAGDGERMAEALNALVTIEPPLLEGGERAEPDDFPAFLDFTRADFERRYLSRYGSRLREFQGQRPIDLLCERLEHSPEESAGIVLVEPGEMASGSAPGLVSADLNVIDGDLFASFVLRDSDVYTDWPLEAMALVRLHRELAERLGRGVGTSTFVIHAARLHERDFERSLRVLKASFRRPLPLHVDPSGVFLFGNDGGKARAMLLDHDASEIFWEDAFSDPEDLSWYIIDVMPWLLPQHIRYVGQECAALMRSMAAGECYLQG